MLSLRLLTASLAVVPALLLTQADPARKVSARLWDVASSDLPGGGAKARMAGAAPPRGARVSAAVVPTRGGFVAIHATAEHDPEALAAQLAALGMRNLAVGGRVVSGRLPVGIIHRLPELSNLRFARPSIALLNVGTVTSQGDVALKSDLARATYGLSGVGVKVGVLSDSFDNLGGMATGIAKGDLPAGTQILKDYVPAAGEGPATDEGRAMAEIIADVAPGCLPVFYTAWDGVAEFAAGIRALHEAGCQVIVDDVIYLDEPMFADGIIAQAVDEVVAAGATYFSAAGNAGKQSYEAPFRNSGQGGYHDFDAASGVDTTLNISLNTGTTWFVLQWPDRYASTMAGNPGAATDLALELVLYADQARTVTSQVFVSDDLNLGGDPIEIVGVNVGNSWGIQAALRVRVNGAAIPPGLKLVWYSSGSVGQQEHNTSSSTLFGHMNAAGAIAVGAVRYCNTPAYGVAYPTAELWSARGGTPIHYLPDGTPTYELRNKPDLSAPQGANTTFFGTVDYCGVTDAFPNFFGTSAAAPHAAGVAALILQARPGMSPAQVRKILQETSVDILPAGFDFDSGSGLIQADAALARATLPGPVLQSVVSRKVHRNRGSFDLSLPLTGNPGVEGRNGAGLQLVFTFNEPITTATPSVLLGSTSVPVATILGNQVIVDLVEVTQSQWIKVALLDVENTSGAYTPEARVTVGRLLGNCTPDRSVNSMDAYYVQTKNGQAAATTSFRADLNCDGMVTSLDAYMLQTRNGTGLPVAP